MIQLNFRKEHRGGNENKRLFEMKSSAPEEERPGVDASTVCKQPVEYGGLPSHMEGGQHQASARQPRLIADPVCQRRLQDTDTEISRLLSSSSNNNHELITVNYILYVQITELIPTQKIHLLVKHDKK